MLEVVSLTNPEQRKIYLQSFLEQALGTTTWVVSDLRSKFEIQRRVLDKQEYCEDVQVLRASELWKIVLRQTLPEMQIVDQDLVLASVKNELRRLDLDLGNSAENTICDFMNQFAPIIFDEDGDNHLQDWFAKNPRALERWGPWYRIARQFAQHFIDIQMLTSKWSASILVNALKGTDPLWRRNLIVDLGAELSQLESDLLQILAKNCDCKVLRPIPYFSEEFSDLLRPYDFLPVPPQHKDSKSEMVPQPIKTFRFSGRLGEVKHAVAQTRVWLDLGVPLREIAIIAFDIEKYWPSLSEYLAAEGINVQKERVYRYHSLPQILHWMSQLRVAIGRFEVSHLEAATFSNLGNSDSLMGFDDFQVLFTNILGFQDLEHHQALFEYYKTNWNLKMELTVREFVLMALRYWPTNIGGEDILPEIISGFLSQASFKTEMSGGIELKMRFENWFDLLERWLSKKEVSLEPPTTEGLYVSRLSQAEAIESKYRIFLGLSEDDMKAPSLSWVLPGEVHSFNQDYGFYIFNPESRLPSFDLKWMSLANCNEQHFCFPQSDWDGSILSPAQVWMEARISELGVEAIDQSALPETTRWDEIQANHNQPIANMAQQFPEPPLGKPRMSASSLERFRKCPFIFYAEKILGLRDNPEMDLDVDRRSGGILLHAVLEKLLNSELNTEWSSENISQLLDEERVRLGIKVLAEELWTPLREKNTQLLLRLLQHESEWRQRFPKAKIIATELPFQFDYKEFSFSGKIDRINGLSEDMDDLKKIEIIDYKAKNADISAMPSWIKQNDLQLGFYSWVLEKKYVQQLGLVNVIGAFLYSVKTLQRKGFRMREGFDFYDIKNYKAFVSQQEKDSFFGQFETELELVLERISKGDFEPKPMDIQDCKSCQWRGLCRAKHLQR